MGCTHPILPWQQALLPSSSFGGKCEQNDTKCYACMHSHTHIHLYTCTHTHVYTCTHMHMHAHAPYCRLHSVGQMSLTACILSICLHLAKLSLLLPSPLHSPLPSTLTAVISIFLVSFILLRVMVFESQPTSLSQSQVQWRVPTDNIMLPLSEDFPVGVSDPFAPPSPHSPSSLPPPPPPPSLPLPPPFPPRSLSTRDCC